MKLDEYVRQTLLDITNGAASAQKETLLFIAPGLVDYERQNLPQLIKFEVGVSVAKEASGGIRVLTFGEGKAGVSSEQINRISF